MNPERALKIFLVDDDTDFLKLMGALLERRGHEVILSHAGTNAAIEIPDVKPDAVVTDCTGEVGDGAQDCFRPKRGGELVVLHHPVLKGHGRPEFDVCQLLKRGISVERLDGKDQ